MRCVLRFHIIIVSKSIFIRTQFNLKNERIMEYPIERKTLKSFYSKSSFFDLEFYNSHLTVWKKINFLNFIQEQQSNSIDFRTNNYSIVYRKLMFESVSVKNYLSFD
jgi:arsenate reductase-like glutaredoxin family protein